MIGSLHPEKVAQFPIVKSWLRHADAALSVARARAHDEAAMLDELIQENVILQLQHLRTHPSVAGRLAQGTLGLSGWVYDIAHGLVRTYDEAQRKFLSVTPGERAVSGNASK